MENNLFFRTIFCCSDREYEYNNLILDGKGELFVIVNSMKFWIVQGSDQFQALDSLVSAIWNNSHFDYRINACGWGDFEYIVAALHNPVTSYSSYRGTDTEYLKSLSIVSGSEKVYITQEYFEPEAYELYPSMPV